MEESSALQLLTLMEELCQVYERMLRSESDLQAALAKISELEGLIRILNTEPAASTGRGRHEGPSVKNKSIKLYEPQQEDAFQVFVRPTRRKPELKHADPNLPEFTATPRRVLLAKSAETPRTEFLVSPPYSSAKIVWEGPGEHRHRTAATTLLTQTTPYGRERPPFIPAGGSSDAHVFNAYSLRQMREHERWEEATRPSTRHRGVVQQAWRSGQ